MASTEIIILAAGRGERFIASGGQTHKLAAQLQGQSVLAHVIEAVDASGLPWYLVRPEGGTAGMGDSISLGVDARRHASGWLILPGDLPLVQPHSLRCVARGLEESAIVVPHYHQRQGHPVGFRREYLSALLALTGDSGARDIVQYARQRGDVMDLSLSDYGIVQDIDTLSDLHTAEQWLQDNGM